MRYAKSFQLSINKNQRVGEKSWGWGEVTFELYQLYQELLTSNLDADPVAHVEHHLPHGHPLLKLPQGAVGLLIIGISSSWTYTILNHML